MSLDPVLVEKVSKALYELHPFDTSRLYTTGKRDAEAAIRVVFDELGLKEERGTYKNGDLARTLRQRRPDAGSVDEYRFVSDWRPVEQGDAK